MIYSPISRPSSQQSFKDLWIRFTQEFGIELEDGILTVVAWYLVIVCPACSDALEPLADIAVQMVIDCRHIRQQEQDVDG